MNENALKYKDYPDGSGGKMMYDFVDLSFEETLSRPKINLQVIINIK